MPIPITIPGNPLHIGQSGLGPGPLFSGFEVPVENLAGTLITLWASPPQSIQAWVLGASIFSNWSYFLLHCVVFIINGVGVTNITVCNVGELSTGCTLHHAVGLTRCTAQLPTTPDRPLIHIMWITFGHMADKWWITRGNPAYSSLWRHALPNTQKCAMKRRKNCMYNKTNESERACCVSCIWLICISG